MNALVLPLASPDVIPSTLPRLLYIGDVPVESTLYGSALLYRLLRNYPTEKLLILEGNLWRSTSFRRLPNVTYTELPVGMSRLINSRLVRFYGSWLLLNAENKRRAIEHLTAKFRPDAILTVTHGFSWLAAAAFAEKSSLPLHLILHDEWVKSLRVAEWLRPRMEEKFGYYYRRAASRLCVSSYMEQQYRKRYGAIGQVLYPSRGPDTPCFDEPPSRLLKSLINPVFGFGGTINSSGSAKILRQLAEVLSSVGGKVMIFGPLSIERARSLGLDLPNIMIGGMVRSEEMICRFREEADALILPMSFDTQDRPNLEINFPSKLTDYTAAGLPILICGPHYCSAVQWAYENPGVAEIAESALGLKESVLILVMDNEYRMRLARKSLQVGQQYFSHKVANETLHDALRASLSDTKQAQGATMC